MKVVVLGATGFLGRYVCRNLISRGIETIAVARGSKIPSYATRTIRVKSYRELPSDLRGTACLHLATPGHFVDLSPAERATETDESVATTKWLADFGFSKIVLASSAIVYGDSLGRNASETDPCVATNDYAKLKEDCENALDLSQHAVARISNVFGIGMSEKNVLNDILKQIRTPGSPPQRITVRDLSPVRDYISVKDVAQALGTMVTSGFTGILNVGTGVPRSVGEIAELLLKVFTLENVKLVSLSEPQRSSYLVLDPSKAAESLPWRAVCDMQKEFALFRNDTFEEEKL